MPTSKAPKTPTPFGKKDKPITPESKGSKMIPALSKKGNK